MTMQVLRRWRAHVWDVVLEMLRARRPGERDRVVAAMGRRAAAIGRALALPSALYVAIRPLFADGSGAASRRGSPAAFERAVAALP
jgi:hypothetical protein